MTTAGVCDLISFSRSLPRQAARKHYGLGRLAFHDYECKRHQTRNSVHEYREQVCSAVTTRIFRAGIFEIPRTWIATVVQLLPSLAAYLRLDSTCFYLLCEYDVKAGWTST